MVRKTVYTLAIIVLQMGEEKVVFAQAKLEASVQYTTELQSDLGNRLNWVNLLSLRVAIPTERLGLWSNGKLEVQTISVYKTSRERIAGDRQVFSNIEEDNLPFSPFLLGYSQQIGKVLLFGGLRNVNEDYFTTPYTSLFTNSSCGIYPTLSANYVLANYPLSAVCLHLEYRINEMIGIKNSLYNGQAYLPFKQGSSVFAVSPQRDGLMDIAEMDYTTNSSYHGSYNLGIVVHGGNRCCDAADDSLAPEQASAETTSEKHRKVNYACWLSVEQECWHSGRYSAGVLGQYSFAPSDRNDCRRYMAAGGIFKGLFSASGEDTLGVVFSQASFSDIREKALEITWNYTVSNHFSVQPAFHFIRTGNERSHIAMLRVMVEY
ncbi:MULTISPECIES: carbohydrate porin [Parabacteroides]|uniref:carbohydrate porin n=2 Tax=Parabacteroides leei TaxID=2939491 RepID=UPI00189C3D7D|nr:carbohydrate porin [Parabacteroides goldsteinii]